MRTIWISFAPSRISCGGDGRAVCYHNRRSDAVIRRRFLKLPRMAFLWALGLALPLLGHPQAVPIVSARAAAIHNSALVIDMHEDTPQRFLDENYDIGSTDPKDPDFISLDKASAGNLGAVFFSIWADPATNKGQFAKRSLELIDAVYEQAARHPDRMVVCFSAGDMERAHAGHKLAALMGIEGGHSIESNLSLLRDFYRLGARYMTLTWRNTNEWADSSGDLDDPTVRHHGGLTDFGKTVVLEMNRLGMMVDISHVSDKTFWDTLAISKAPIIASHSSSRALIDNPRNITDDMLRAIAKNGGVANVNFDSGFLDQKFDQDFVARTGRMLEAEQDFFAARRSRGQAVTSADTQSFESQWMNSHPLPPAPLKSLIDHIDHMVKVAAVDHVGLGSDYDGPGSLPTGIETALGLPRITQGLLDRGYSPNDIRKILGGNMVRVLTDVERVGRNLRANQ